MQKQEKVISKARFDTKLPLEQKEMFEFAANLGGFRTLTEFIISSAQEKANEIINRHNLIISSDEDRKMFFDAILNPVEPNVALTNAAERYKATLNK